MSFFIYGLHAIEALINAQADCVERLLITGVRQPEWVEQAKQHRILVQNVSKQELENLIGKSTVHQGIVAQCKSVASFNEEMLFALLDQLSAPPLLLLLDGVQDPHNLGAILRTANAFGVHAVIAPKDRAVGLTPVVHKVACGAAALTPFIQVTNLSRTMEKLKERGIWLVGLDEHDDTCLSEVDLTGNIGLVAGNEGQGIRQLTRKNCDHVAKIPLSGDITSLNVSVSVGCALYEASRQRG